MIVKKSTLLAIILVLIVINNSFSQVQVDKFSGDASYGLPLITIPNFRGPSVSTSILYNSDIKVDQQASEIGLGWNINAGGSIERIVRGIPDDWRNVTTANIESASFRPHYGALHLNSAPNGAFQEYALDFSYTRYGMDTLSDSIKFYYPNYDAYYVVGSGMSGEITPENYDYPEINVQSKVIDGNVVEDHYTLNNFNYKTHFRYNHNTYSEVNSVYFPWNESPINPSSSIDLPGTYSQTFDGNGYNNENHSSPENQNRSRTANYIQYYTNSELATGTINGFLEYDTAFNRGNGTDFPANGIGAYQITDPNGYTYHYSLPVYTHYQVNGSVSIDKDYNEIIPSEGEEVKTEHANGSYVLKHSFTNALVESKQNAKYAVRWLLTAITGPDFEDDGNGVVDLNDQGYWVKYDYGLWTDDFPTRFPYYGASYAYTKDIEEDLTAFKDINDSNRNSGKLLTYSETANQQYYLNQIQTPSHTGIFCRDYRNDEQSIVNFSQPKKTEYIQVLGEDLRDTALVIDHFGTSIELESIHPNGDDFSHQLLIQPENYGFSNTINLTFQVLSTFLDVVFDVKIYDGTSASGTLLLHRHHDGNTSVNTSSIHNLTATSGAIFIDVVNVVESPSNIGQGLKSRITWNTEFPKLGDKVPQLKLSKLLLVDNDDLSSLPVLSSIDTTSNDKIWRYSSLNRSSCYHMDWYLANKSVIDNIALQSVALQQDYSLAKNYINNRYVSLDSSITSSDRMNQVEIDTNKLTDLNNVDQSGKLTLNKVIYYGTNGTQIQPAHLFDYNASDANDNPNYISFKQDYWGNYKSDGENNLLRGYVTSLSETNVDAWSLRKITSPLGGVTEIVYESDEYEQVISEFSSEGLRGPIKTFAISEANTIPFSVGNAWAFWLENQEAEFWSLAIEEHNSSTITKNIVIPGVWVDTSKNITDPNYYPYNFQNDISNSGTSVSYGSGLLSESSGSHSTFVSNQASLLNYYEINWGELSQINGNGQYGYSTTTNYTLVYGGEGYVSFNYPIGQKIKGGGTRVKELKVSGDGQTYTVAYTYNEGTATAEASDYSIGKFKKDKTDYDYDWGLTAFEISPFGLNPQVGYGKVTIENKGLVNESEGKTHYAFHASNTEKDYYRLYTEKLTSSITGPYCGPGGHGVINNRKFAIELIDDFSSIWGKIKEQTIEDVNAIVISKKVYDYEASSNGAHINTICYNTTSANNSNDCFLTNNSYNIAILRKYPNYLNKVTTYSNGQKSESTILDRDVFTGSPILTENTSVNGTTTKEELLLAHTDSNYSTMGAKSDNPQNNNFLNATYSSKTFRESENLTTQDFLSYGKSFWKNTASVRSYDATNHQYVNNTEPVNWFDYTQYSWVGDLGDYGLYSNSAFTDISAPPTTASDWRLLSEITLMDEEQNVLEQKGFNNRFTSSKLGYNNRYTYTSASNSNYVSFTATGFETFQEVEPGIGYYEGEVLANTSDERITDDGTIFPHTGNYMVKIPENATTGPLYSVKYVSTDSIYSLQRDRTYSASVWVHKDSPNDVVLTMNLIGLPNSVSASMRKDNSGVVQIGDWVQLTVSVDVPADFTCPSSGDGLHITIGKTSTTDAAWVDDLQFKSNVTSSGMTVYDQKTGRVMATLSDNNFGTKYTYNDAGQVVGVWKEILNNGIGKWVEVERRDFNFQRPMEQ